MHSLALIEVLGLWLAWSYPYFFIAPKVQKRPSITMKAPSRAGIFIQTAGILTAWFFRVPGAPRTGPAEMAAALIFGLVGVVLMFTAVRHLGRQFRIQAGLYHDHELVRSGPYAVVRHPIYASMLAMTLATGVLITQWAWMPVAIVLFIAGTEIRVRTEDKLLESRFKGEFREYQARVRAYLPFVR